MRTLVTYATVNGSTREIAERVAGVLGQAGVQTEVQSIETATGLVTFGAIVAGSAVHDRAWLAPAQAFLETNAALLRQVHFWAFSVGMPAALGRRWGSMADREAEKLLAGFPDAVRPFEHRLFSGVIRREHLSFAGHLAFKALGGTYGDYRDWPRIDAWAASIAGELIRLCEATPVQPGNNK